LACALQIPVPEQLHANPLFTGPNPVPPFSSTILPPVPSLLRPSSTLLDFFPSVRSVGSETDDSSWGDSIAINPGEHHRIYFQNIDGVRNESDEIDL